MSNRDTLAYDVDYSADPTVKICLACTAANCPGSCLRAARIIAGLGDPGAAYNGKRYMDKGFTLERTKAIAERFGISVRAVNAAKTFTIDEDDLIAYLKKEYGDPDDAEKREAAIRECAWFYDFDIGFVRALRVLCKNDDELQERVRAAWQERHMKRLVEYMARSVGTSKSAITRLMRKGMTCMDIREHYKAINARKERRKSRGKKKAA